MWWPFRHRSVKPAMPAYEPKPITVRTEHAPPVEPEIIVDEIDTSDMTKTGVHRAWDRMTKGFKDVG